MDGICIPGMQMEKQDCSDSDSDVREAFYKEKAERRAREQVEEERQAEIMKERKAMDEANKDREQVLSALLFGDQAEKVLEFLSSIDLKRPETYEERMQSANTLREKGNELWSSGDKSKVEECLNYWYGAVHCLDFTSAQIKDMSEQDRLGFWEPLAKVLSNISTAYHKQRDDAQGAIRAVNLALYVVAKLPYSSSKALREKLYIRRALARGDIRNFKDALSDANHVLTLTKGHEEATCIVTNCKIALRKESLEKEKRWKGPLNRPIPKKSVPKSANLFQRFQWPLVALALLLLLVGVWRYMATAPAIDGKSAEL